MKLIIIGAGGIGSEALWIARRTLAGNQGFREIAGFADDNPEILGKTVDGVPVLGTVSQVFSSADPRNVRFHCAIGSNKSRRKIAVFVEAMGFRPVSLIDSTAIVAETSQVGEGTFIGPLSIVAPHAHIGKHVLVNTYAGVGHHAIVGDFAQLCPGVRINGGCRIDTGAFLGSNAVVHPGLSVGEGASVGAGSFVIRSVKPRHSVLGVPARIVSRPAENGPNAQA